MSVITRITIGDLPTDRARSLSALNKELCSTFNYCRAYPDKMSVLKDSLKFVHAKIVAFEKEEAEKTQASATASSKANQAQAKAAAQAIEALQAAAKKEQDEADAAAEALKVETNKQEGK